MARFVTRTVFLLIGLRLSLVGVGVPLVLATPLGVTTLAWGFCLVTAPAFRHARAFTLKLTGPFDSR